MKSMLLPDSRLIKKYDQPVPRYTSYPTVPFWQNNLNVENYKDVWKNQFAISNSGEGISIYIHLPFCESLCTYCGCNKKITTNHKVEVQYLEMLKKEWGHYLKMMNKKPIIRELHLGGGTPTFFSPKNLNDLLEMIFEKSEIHPDHEFSIEGHPNNTTIEQMQVLFDKGFRRISFGVQDNDPIVQKIINRIQAFENVVRVTKEAREIGFESVNYDLIYGLPKQTLLGMERTIEQVISLKPDRIAYYSYAHVPWTSKGQRLFDENDLPNPEKKLQLYLLGKRMLTDAGYTDIGMDHFSLEGDGLLKAFQNGTLHRNFMGYTTQNTSFLIGLGVSSISDTGNAFAQNYKSLHEYYESVEADELPIFRGYLLSEEDIIFKKYILDVACKGKVEYRHSDLEVIESYCIPELLSLAEDGLVEIFPNGISVTELGRNFTRNICKAFDLYLMRNYIQKDKPIFSKSV